MKVAYYPGNVARGAMMEVEDCIQPLCKTLGIDLIELPKATSDGGNIIRQASPRLQHALAARNLALAEEKGLDIMTSCATSHSIHCDTASTMEANPVMASQLNNLIARTSKIEYAGESKSRHLLHLLVEEIGPRQGQSCRIESSQHEGRCLLRAIHATRRFLWRRRPV